MQRNDQAAAFEHYKKYAEADKAYLNDVKARELAYQLVKHETLQKNQTIALLNNKNKVMYEEGGHAYVYISYGMHHMLNVVTSSRGNGHAVLIRAVEPITGIDTIKTNRKVAHDNHKLTGGPGKLCQALGITKEMNLQKFYKKDAFLQIWDDGYIVEDV